MIECITSGTVFNVNFVKLKTAFVGFLQAVVTYRLRHSAPSISEQIKKQNVFK